MEFPPGSQGGRGLPSGVQERSERFTRGEVELLWNLLRQLRCRQLGLWRVGTMASNSSLDQYHAPLMEQLMKQRVPAFYQFFRALRPQFKNPP
ncbi:hypothetical protein NDU88_002790 [Pleurodeles waltl]|uniref:Uncharacterized protein n=1 Tax=Pleurodeles waltl TaxID=8319 RepID=A0AAV7NET3_PLEWA|nr:hypothetical protein NDU88_002790 [Pleurodeles waltl]